jgi:glycosyltransferase involved in cell wall biosynthesis
LIFSLKEEMGVSMAKTYKILMLIENAPVPFDNRVWAEATTLRDHGFQVSMIGPKGPTKYRESHICIDGIHIYRYGIPTNTSKYTAYILEYSISLLMTFLLSFKVLFRHGFDVIHTANPPDLFFIIGLFYRLLGKKFIFDQHDLAPEMFQVKFNGRMKPVHKLLLFLERCSYRTASAVITTNLSQKRFAIERGHCHLDKVFVVRNGPELDRIKLVTPEPELKRGRHYLLTYVGEMGIQDGIDNALYALHHLVHKRGRQDVLLVLMGDGDYAPTLHKLAHELSLDEYVYFTGWVEAEDIVRYLTVADVGISPDPQNGLNEYCTMVKTMEYMAMGKPTVAFDLAETRFSAQDAALYATPNLVEDFAGKIETLLADKELRLRMGAFGRKRIEELLNWENDKQNLLQAYESLFSRSYKRPEKENDHQGPPHPTPPPSLLQETGRSL